MLYRISDILKTQPAKPGHREKMEDIKDEEESRGPVRKSRPAEDPSSSKGTSDIRVPEKPINPRPHKDFDKDNPLRHKQNNLKMLEEKERAAERNKNKAKDDPAKQKWDHELDRIRQQMEKTRQEMEKHGPKIETNVDILQTKVDRTRKRIHDENRRRRLRKQLIRATDEDEMPSNPVLERQLDWSAAKLDRMKLKKDKMNLASIIREIAHNMIGVSNA